MMLDDDCNLGARKTFFLTPKFAAKKSYVGTVGMVLHLTFHQWVSAVNPDSFCNQQGFHPTD
jgi:hypothetical protein